MRTFKIYQEPFGEKAVVKQGWSWPASIFGTLWMLNKGMGLIALPAAIVLYTTGILIGSAFCGTPGGHSDLAAAEMICIMANIATSIIFGMFGNRWQEINLKLRGYEVKDIIKTSDPKSAMEKYLIKVAYLSEK